MVEILKKMSYSEIEVGKMDIYICPMCGQENAEHQKYCLNCGKWLLDPNFPAKKKERPKKKIGSIFGSIIFSLAIVGAYWYFTNGGNLNLPVDKVVIDTIENEHFRFSQLEINTGTVDDVPVDFLAKIDISNPVEIVAVFYDENGGRIARASTILTQPMPAGFETTLILKLDTPTSLTKARSVRMEVNPISPLQLLEKTIEALQ